MLKQHTYTHTHGHTHTHTHTHKKNNNNNKKVNTNLLPQGKSTPTTSQTEVFTATVNELDPSTVVEKTSTLDAAGILDPLHSYVSAT